MLNDLTRNGTSTQAAASGQILITGDAGAGKTHLICDLAVRLLKQGTPCLLFFGQQMRASEPWRQMRERTGLGLASNEQFLGALNTAGEMAGTRAIVFLDAMNETIDDPRQWRDELPGMFEILKKYPFVSLALTVRSSYRHYVIPDHVGSAELPVVEHPGFGDVVVDATERFFDHFNIRAPDYPTLDPEFTNPLFLKLFCQAVAGSADPDHERPPSTIPTGMRGFTTVFDAIVKNSNDRLVQQLSLKRDKFPKPVEEAVRQLAKRMAADHTRILPRNVAADIVGDILLPAAPFREPLQAMVSDGLLSFDLFCDSRCGAYIEGVRFAYERFTSHILMKLTLSETFNPDEPRAAFVESSPLGQLVRPEHPWLDSPSDISALLLQLPERHQLELFDICPEAIENREIAHHFLSSFTWRHPDSVNKNAVEFVPKVLHAHPELWESWVLSLLSLAGREDHPLNACYLHSRLIEMSIPDRDATWSILIHNSFAENDLVARMIRWAWRPDASSQVSAPIAFLYGTVLAWFFTSPNRSLRDRATKAAVSILTLHLRTVRRLLSSFEKVGDPYVAERLYAVAYGCCQRSKGTRGLAGLAKYVYDTVFKDGKPSPNILLRDYARGIIEFAAHRGVVKKMDLRKIRPPYSSIWPTRLPPKSWAAKHLRYDKELTPVELAERALGSSIVEIESDFCRYILSSRLQRWSRHRLGAPRPRTPIERRERLVASLTGRQRRAWETYQQVCERIRQSESLSTLDRLRTSNGAHYRKKPNSEYAGAAKQARLTLIRTLGTRKKSEFQAISRQSRRPFNTETPRVNRDGACRWMFKRALQIGGISERVARFDNNIGYHGRTAHDSERFGKKYQWIAFYECLAKLADNLEFHQDVHGEEFSKYEGPWQLSYIRNIDPSWTADEPKNTGWGPHNPSQWSPLMCEWKADLSHAEWIDSERDLCNPRQLLQFDKWLCLRGSFCWRQELLHGRQLEDCTVRNFDAWTSAYVVRADTAIALKEWLWNESANATKPISQHLMPEGRSADAFLGERFWSSAYRYFDDRFYYGGTWSRVGPENQPIDVCASFERYADDSGYDHSFEFALKAHFPSEWLAHQLHLRWSGCRADFVDKSGSVVAFDPSVKSAGPSVLLVDKLRLRRALARSGYTIVWLYEGYKSVLLASHERGPRPKHRYVMGVYTLGPKGLEGAWKSAIVSL